MLKNVLNFENIYKKQSNITLFINFIIKNSSDYMKTIKKSENQIDNWT